MLSFNRALRRLVGALPILVVLSAVATADAAVDETFQSQPIRHVLLVSVDGLHASDLARWTGRKRASALSRLREHGVLYTAAEATTPSDSFPGMLALATGGTPRSTGVYYDDSFDRTLYAPGSACRGKPGTEVVFTGSIDEDSKKLFTAIDPADLPLRLAARGRCVPVFPHDYLKTNTVFEVARRAGLGTAWSDKHPAYDILNGPSGKGVMDLYVPEIDARIRTAGIVQGIDLGATIAQCDGTNSLPPAQVRDFSDCVPAEEAYDDLKVKAVLNEIDGKRSDGTAGPGVPAIFGTNLQAVSIAEKLPAGGYRADGAPSALLLDALAHADAAIGKIVAHLQARGLWDSTVLIVAAKHGQSPLRRATLAMEGSPQAAIRNVVDPLAIVNRVDPAVDAQTFHDAAQSNGARNYATAGHLQEDDVGILWLQDDAPKKVVAVAKALEENAAAIHAGRLSPGMHVPGNIVYGRALAAIFGDPHSADAVAHARAPDIFIQPNAGVIYSTSTKKIAEHGGGSADDIDVALIVAGGRVKPRVVTGSVSTTQVAATILSVLGLNPQDLAAVREEHTKPLPGLALRGYGDRKYHAQKGFATTKDLRRP